MIKNCEICGKEFELKKPTQKYCNVKCRNVKSARTFNSKHPDIIKKSNRIKQYKLRYDITINDYNRLFEEQGGCCKICGKHQIEIKKRLNVDHNHITKKVRGLLCTACNRGIGFFQDDITLLDKARKYLLEDNESIKN